MKVAITSDLHLDPAYYKDNFDNIEDIHLGVPENKYFRWAVLNEILLYCRENEIKDLIIAGDLFDKKSGFLEFEKVIENFLDVNIHIIKGNHDYFLKKEFFSKKPNLFIYEEPAFKKIKDVYFVFLPYSENSFLVEDYLKVRKHIPSNSKIVLISHSEIVGEEKNIYNEEKKIYYPLVKKELKMIDANLIFLGHIHQHKDSCIDNKVFYCTSPSALNSNEEGIRKFIVLDLNKPLFAENVDFVYLQNGYLYYRKEIFTYDDDEEYLKYAVDILMEEIMYNIAKKDIYGYVEEKERERILKSILPKRVVLYVDVVGITAKGKDYIENVIINFLKKRVYFFVIETENLSFDNEGLGFLANKIKETSYEVFHSCDKFFHYKDKKIYQEMYNEGRKTADYICFKIFKDLIKL